MQLPALSALGMYQPGVSRAHDGLDANLMEVDRPLVVDRWSLASPGLSAESPRLPNAPSTPPAVVARNRRRFNAVFIASLRLSPIEISVFPAIAGCIIRPITLGQSSCGGQRATRLSRVTHADEKQLTLSHMAYEMPKCPMSA